MDELTISIIDRGSASLAALQTALGQFAAQSRARVHVRFQPWQEARQSLGKTGFPNDGSIDIAEIDTAWMSDVIASDTLRPYSAHEMDQCRASDEYLPALLECTHLVGETDTWAVPWLADTILLHYRKDLFVSARINPQMGLCNLAELQATAKSLSAAGIHIPIALPCKVYPSNLIRIVASWVWRAGGDFIHRDGKQVLFDQPEFIQGVKDYFHLYQTLSPEGRQTLATVGTQEALFKHNAAMAIGGPWVMQAPSTFPNPEFARNLAVARLPGVPFVGGSTLAIRRGLTCEREAIELVQFLSTSPSIIAYARQAGLAPARLRGINSPELSASPAHAVLVESIRCGRTLPAVKQWSMIEERLGQALSSICSQLLAAPARSADNLITRTLSQTAREINHMLAQ